MPQSRSVLNADLRSRSWSSEYVSVEMILAEFGITLDKRCLILDTPYRLVESLWRDELCIYWKFCFHQNSSELTAPQYSQKFVELKQQSSRAIDEAL